MIEKEIEDYVTKIPTGLYENYRTYKNYKSGEMKYFFGLLRKLRAWRLVAKSRNSNAITSKLSYVIRSALEKKQKDEIKINSIKKSIMGLL